MLVDLYHSKTRSTVPPFCHLHVCLQYSLKVLIAAHPAVQEYRFINIQDAYTFSNWIILCIQYKVMNNFSTVLEIWSFSHIIRGRLSTHATHVLDLVIAFNILITRVCPFNRDNKYGKNSFNWLEREWNGSYTTQLLHCNPCKRQLRPMGRPINICLLRSHTFNDLFLRPSRFDFLTPLGSFYLL